MSYIYRSEAPTLFTSPQIQTHLLVLVSNKDMEAAFQIGEQDIRKKEPIILTSPKNPTPIETVFLSNLDQTVAFPVETIYIYEPTKVFKHEDIEETLRNSLSQVLLIPYYFMAGRMNFNLQTNRMELVCNNAGIYFVGATTSLEIKDLKDVCAPNPSFQHLLLRTDMFKDLSETPLLTVQVSIYISVNVEVSHQLYDAHFAKLTK